MGSRQVPLDLVEGTSCWCGRKAGRFVVTCYWPRCNVCGQPKCQQCYSVLEVCPPCRPDWGEWVSPAEKRSEQAAYLALSKIITSRSMYHDYYEKHSPLADHILHPRRRRPYKGSFTLEMEREYRELSKMAHEERKRILRKVMEGGDLTSYEWANLRYGHTWRINGNPLYKGGNK